MSRLAILLAAIAIAVIAIGNVMLGWNLVMPLADAQEKGVGAGPWFLVWGMIAVTALSAAVLVAYLVSTGLRGSNRR